MLYIEMHEQVGDGGRSQPWNTARLPKGLRAGAFKPLDHFMREAANRVKIEICGDNKPVMLVQAVKCSSLRLYIAAVERISER